MKLSTAHLNGTCPKRSMSAFSVNRILLFPFLILNYDRFKTVMKKGISKWDNYFFFLFTAKVIVYHEIPDPVLYSIVKLSVKKKLHVRLDGVFLLLILFTYDAGLGKPSVLIFPISRKFLTLPLIYHMQYFKINVTILLEIAIEPGTFHMGFKLPLCPPASHQTYLLLSTALAFPSPEGEKPSVFKAWPILAP